VKWVFLLKRETLLESDDAFYEFVPYNFGPFSFQLYRDVSDLRRDGYIALNSMEINHILYRELEACNKGLPEKYKLVISRVLYKYGKFYQSFLLNDIYQRYPWYASKSKLIKEIKTNKPTNGSIPYIATAGYQEESIDHFLKKLLRSEIECIIDVRSNPVSRKYGYSKSQLQSMCEKIKMDYVHFRELGVPSSLRMNLDNEESYYKLLEKYEKEILPQNTDACERAGNTALKKRSVLMCYEKDKNFCHRSRLALSISEKTGLEVRHL
jgi:uncharacterized protein (DUF488 family)